MGPNKSKGSKEHLPEATSTRKSKPGPKSRKGLRNYFQAIPAPNNNSSSNTLRSEEPELIEIDKPEVTEIMGMYKPGPKSRKRLCASNDSNILGREPELIEIDKPVPDKVEERRKFKPGPKCRKSLRNNFCPDPVHDSSSVNILRSEPELIQIDTALSEDTETVKCKPGPKSRKSLRIPASNSSEILRTEPELIQIDNPFRLPAESPLTEETETVKSKPGPKSRKSLRNNFCTVPASNSSDISRTEPEPVEILEIVTIEPEIRKYKPGPKSKKKNLLPNSEPEEEEPKKSEQEPTSDNDDPEGVYEVEEVLDYVNEKGGNNAVGEMYYIKWKNWDSDFNTWEKPENVADCVEELLTFYYKRKAEVEQQIAAQVYIEDQNGKRRRKGPEIWKIPPDPRPLEDRLNEFYSAVKPLCEVKLMEKYLLWNKLRRSKKGKDMREKWSDAKLNQYLTDGKEDKLSEKQMKDLRKELYHVEAERKKAILDEKLKEWEMTINEVTQCKPFIKVENEVDFENPPENFVFVPDYIPAEGITIPSDPPLGCSCAESCYENRKVGCCAKLSGGKFAYNRHKKLAVQPGTPIWECNKKCSCGPDCINRVVQDGSATDVKLCIFRTDNGCGWGVKALKSIKRGCFVCLYVGEVIFAEEAERRSAQDKSIQPYLFDLDFNNFDKPIYIVDGSRFGNVSHFINHSCNPNLSVFAVWVDCLDPNLPKLALFAVRDIARGEELSFDYLNQASSESMEEDSSGETASSNTPKFTSSQTRQKCLCGAENCRNFLYV